MTVVHVLRVFVGADRGGGNPLGVVLDGPAVSEAARGPLARELGFSETVFVDDRPRAELRIFTPGLELPFAGHPLVGTAWLLARQGAPPSLLRPPVGEVRVRYEDDLTWIAGRAEWSPPLPRIEHSSPAGVDALDPAAERSAYHWAWQDEAAGRVRARAFFKEAGIDEDEATGSAAIALCATLGRELEIDQGRGSLLHARPLEGGFAEVGGRTELVDERPLPL